MTSPGTDLTRNNNVMPWVSPQWLCNLCVLLFIFNDQMASTLSTVLKTCTYAGILVAAGSIWGPTSRCCSRWPGCCRTVWSPCCRCTEWWSRRSDEDRSGRAGCVPPGLDLCRTPLTKRGGMSRRSKDRIEQLYIFLYSILPKENEKSENVFKW